MEESDSRPLGGMLTWAQLCLSIKASTQGLLVSFTLSLSQSTVN